MFTVDCPNCGRPAPIRESRDFLGGASFSCECDTDLLWDTAWDVPANGVFRLSTVESLILEAV